MKSPSFSLFYLCFVLQVWIRSSSEVIYGYWWVSLCSVSIEVKILKFPVQLQLIRCNFWCCLCLWCPEKKTSCTLRNNFCRPVFAVSSFFNFTLLYRKIAAKCTRPAWEAFVEIWSSEERSWEKARAAGDASGTNGSPKFVITWILHVSLWHVSFNHWLVMAERNKWT